MNDKINGTVTETEAAEAMDNAELIMGRDSLSPSKSPGPSSSLITDELEAGNSNSSCSKMMSEDVASVETSTTYCTCDGSSSRTDTASVEEETEAAAIAEQKQPSPTTETLGKEELFCPTHQSLLLVGQLEDDICSKTAAATSSRSSKSPSSDATTGSISQSTDVPSRQRDRNQALRSTTKQQMDDTTMHMVGAIALIGPPPTRAAAGAPSLAEGAAAIVQQELDHLDQTIRAKIEGATNGGGVPRIPLGVVNTAPSNTNSIDPVVVGDEEDPMGAQMIRESGNSMAWVGDGAPSPSSSPVSSLVSSPPSVHVLVEAELVEPDQTILVTAKEVIYWKSRRKGVILLAILVLIILVAVLVAKFAVDDGSAHSKTEHKQHEVNEVRHKFEYDALRLLESIGTRLDLTMRAADSFMFQVVSESRSKDSKWPLITVPDLAVKSAKLLSQTKSIYMAFYPLITAEKRGEWENFTKYNDEWVEEGLQVQSRNPNFQGPILEDYDVSHVIWKNEGPVDPDSPGPFMPSWMGSPIIPYYFPYNWNALAYEAFSKPLLATMDTKSVVFAPVANHADPNDPVAVAHSKVTNDWAMPYLAEGEDPSEPFSDMYYPVIKMIDDVMLDLAHDNGTEVLGSVAFSFYWRDVMKNTLSNDSKGLTIVFQNPCGDQFFTYHLWGTVPIFLGYGDLHDGRYDDMGLSSKLTDLLNNKNNGLLYTGLPTNADFCPYTLTVYPSDIYTSELQKPTEAVIPATSSPQT